MFRTLDIGSGLMIAAGSVAGWGIINSIAA